jgi:hypothetical protein
VIITQIQKANTVYIPPTDKLLHVLAGALSALPGLLLGWPFAAATCAAAAVLREVYNLHQGGRFDPADIAATLAGGALVVSAALIGPVGVVA